MECCLTRVKIKLNKLVLIQLFALFILSTVIQVKGLWAQEGSSSILDFDGDGITDPGTYSLNFGRMTLRWLKSSDSSIGVAKIDGDYAVPANYLGDGLSQPAAVEVKNGKLIWNILDLKTNKKYSIPFGSAGDTIISGCHFISQTQATLSFIRGRTLYFRKYNGGARKVLLRKLPRGDFAGCGDINGNGIDELIARAPGLNSRKNQSNQNSVFVFNNRGFGKIFKQVYKYANLIAVKRPSSDDVPLVILARGLSSDLPGAKVEALRGTFKFPILPLSSTVELTTGVFRDVNDGNISGLLWRPKGQNRIIQRLLVEGSRDTEVFQIWSLERMLKSINVQKTR